MAGGEQRGSLWRFWYVDLPRSPRPWAPRAADAAADGCGPPDGRGSRRRRGSLRSVLLDLPWVAQAVRLYGSLLGGHPARPGSLTSPGHPGVHSRRGAHPARGDRVGPRATPGCGASSRGAPCTCWCERIWRRATPGCGASSRGGARARCDGGLAPTRGGARDAPGRDHDAVAGGRVHVRGGRPHRVRALRTAGRLGLRRGGAAGAGPGGRCSGSEPTPSKREGRTRRATRRPDPADRNANVRVSSRSSGNERPARPNAPERQRSPHQGKGRSSRGRRPRPAWGDG
jgi:hypothetical protein